MSQIRILVFDFQFLTRKGLSQLINAHQDFHLVGESENASQLIRDIKKTTPDILIVGDSGHYNELKVYLEEIMAKKLTRVLIITANEIPDQVQYLLDIGIRGIITKYCSEGEIENAIHAVVKEHRFLCHKILNLILTRTNGIESNENCDPVDLSPREFDVLRLVTKGLKTVEIADRLHVSHHTINSHRKNILKKWNLKSPAELIVYAMKNRIVKHDKDQEVV